MKTKSYDEMQFGKEVSKAYDILWDIFEPSDGNGCNYNISLEKSLLKMINCIDKELDKLKLFND